MALDPLEPEQEITVPENYQGNPINTTFSWYVESRLAYPRRHKNIFTPLINGEEAFKALAEALNDAKESIDIICWGFDPGMPLIRPANGVFASKQAYIESTYGYHLEQAVKRGVKVHLLVWKIVIKLPGGSEIEVHQYAQVQKLVDNNLVGVDGYRGELQRNQAYRSYSAEWFDKVNSGEIPILFNTRDLKKHGIYKEDTLLYKPNEKLSGGIIELGMALYSVLPGEQLSLSFPSDHQKTVVIDYFGEKPVGFVMGHNSVTKYWDTKQMLYSNVRREGNFGPWHDVSLKVEGDCLTDIFDNFYKAWRSVGGEYDKHPNSITVKAPDEAKSSGQVVLTEPRQGIKTIKESYFLATQNARRYILIVNQYFQYPEWARHLKESVTKAKAQGYEGSVHVFAVTCEPEQAGQIYRGHQMANELGVGNQFPTAQNQIFNKDGTIKENTGVTDGGYSVDVPLSEEEYQQSVEAYRKEQQEFFLPDEKKVSMKEEDIKSTQDFIDNIVESYAANNKSRTEYKKTPRLSRAQVERMGVKAHFCMLKSSTKTSPARYKDIYIHAKVMAVDDAFSTLGSANMNIRSMAVDSEINLSSDDIDTAYFWRKELLDLYTGGKLEQPAKHADMARYYKDFGKFLTNNEKKVKEKIPLTGFIVPFLDNRSATTEIAG